VEADRWRGGAPDLAHDVWFLRTSDRCALRRAGVGRSCCSSNRYSIRLRSHPARLPPFPFRRRVVWSLSPRPSSSRYLPLVQYPTARGDGQLCTSAPRPPCRQGATRRAGHGDPAPGAGRTLAGGGRELLPSPGGRAGAERQGSPVIVLLAEAHLDRDPPSPRSASGGDAGGRGVRRRRDGAQPRALDRERCSAKHRAGRSLPRRGDGFASSGATRGVILCSSTAAERVSTGR
jgi:hypothetical protein